MLFATEPRIRFLLQQRQCDSTGFIEIQSPVEKLTALL
jgi:hypothetical protein